MSLIAHYKLDGNPNDLMGNHDGTEFGSVVYSKGFSGGALDNTADNDVGIRVMVSSDADKFNNRHSWSLWFKSTSSSSRTVNRVISRDCSDYMCFYINQSVSPNTTVPLGESIVVGEWYHLVATTNNGTNYNWYLNGVFSGSTNEPLSGATRPWVIGNNTEGDNTIGGASFVGEIADVRFYDDVLSEKEIKENYKSLVLYKFQEDNTNNAVTVPDAPTILGSTSIAFWLYPTTTDRQTIWDNGYGGEGTINFESTSRQLRLYSGPNGNNNAGYESVDSEAVPLNEWTHAVVTREMSSGTVNWYLNGQLSTTGSFSFSTIGETTFDLRIGTGYTTIFAGSLREVKQFATVLDATEVENLYKAGLAVDNTGNMHSPYIKEGFPYLSPVSGGLVDNDPNDGVTAECDPCSGEVTFEAAVAYAEAQGGRLPTKEELENDATQGTGCGYDGTLNWSCTKGIDDTEHWVVVGNSANGTPPEIRKNTETATVRWVRDDDLNRPDPTYISDSVIQNQLGINASEIQRESTKQNSFSEVGLVGKGLRAFGEYKLDSTLYLNEKPASISQDIRPVECVDGVCGLSFRGIGAEETIYDFSPWEPSNVFSFSAFVYPKELGALQIFASHGLPYFALTNSVFFSFFDATNTQRTISGGSVNLNQWNHWCATHDGSTARIYLNGVEVNSLSATLSTYSDPLLYVGDHAGSDYPYNGLVARLKIFNTVLSSEDVANEYNYGKASINKNTAYAKEFIEV